MKSAEEWWDDTLPGSFAEVETKFRDGSEIIEWVKQIQADALREAAEIAYQMEVGTKIRDAILAKAKEIS